MFREKQGPFLKSRNSTDKIMLHLVLALIPLCLFAIYKNGIIPFYNGKSNILEVFRIVFFLMIGPVTTYATEFIYAKLFIKDKKTSEYMESSYSFIPGLFLALIMPLNTPIIYLIFGCIIATVIGKMLFGGLGQNIFNPALIGYLIIMTCYGSNFTYLNQYEIDTLSGATPLSNIVTNLNYKELVAPYGNLWDFFIGTIPGSIGETCSLLIILAFIYLTLKKVIKWRIPVFYVGTVFVVTTLIGIFNNVGVWYPLFQILSGGLLFGAVFMATDPVTSPTTKEGQIIYGILLGILTVILRYLTSSPEGVSIAILTMNMLVFIVEKIAVASKNNKNIYIITITLLISISLLLGYGISNKFKETDEVDKNYEIISKDVNNLNTKYIVTQVGNSGKIKAEIIIKDNVIISMKVLEHNETGAYYQKVIDSNFINKLVKEKNIENVDTVSGATISSNALKKMALNTLKDYAKGDNNE